MQFNLIIILVLRSKVGSELVLVLIHANHDVLLGLVNLGLLERRATEVLSLVNVGRSESLVCYPELIALFACNYFVVPEVGVAHLLLLLQVVVDLVDCRLL